MRVRDFCRGTQTCRETLAEPKECFVELKSQICAVNWLLGIWISEFSLLQHGLIVELVLKIAFIVNMQIIGVAVLCKRGHIQAR